MLGDTRFSEMLEKITDILHDDAHYQKGALTMRAQKCFAIKVGHACLCHIIIIIVL